jgi:Tfp pilus assembly protein PilO
VSLLKRVITEKRRVVVPLAIALGVNMLAYALVVQPLAASSEGAANRSNTALAQRRNAERELDLARALVTGKSKADEELDAFYQDVLPTSLGAARRMTYASLPALARETNMRFEQRTFAVEEVQDAPGLGHLSIQMELQGAYENFRDFIYQLESAPEFVIIDDVQLAETGTDQSLTLAITLSAYFRVGPDGI